jgi:cytochrome c-type biogenesis protein CcmH
MKQDKLAARSAGLLLGFLVLVSALPGWSAIETYQFEDAEKEMLYRKLVKELRCTVCQNQDIGDSNAELAQDLRRKTYKMVTEGKDEQYILDYMSQRYGDFVLYSPRMKASTLLLWVGPFIILLAAIIFLVRYVRRTGDDVPLSVEDRAKAEKLLEIDKE